MSEPLCAFEAVLPDIASAINISGAGAGVRIKLDVAESDMGEVIKLVLMRGKLFRVEIYEL